MGKRYVDANVLEDLARNTASTRGDLQALLNSCEWRVNAAPRRGWDQGAWWNVRSTLSGELTLLDQDRSALASRAARVRVVSVEAALREWIESWLRPAYLYTGHLFMDSLNRIDELGDEGRADLIGNLGLVLKYGVPAVAAAGLQRHFTSAGLVAVKGSHLLRAVSGVWGADVMKPSTFAGKVLGGPRGMLIQVPFDAIIYGAQNWALYGEEGMGKVATATATDVILKFAIGAVIAAGVTALAPAAPALLVTVGAGMAAGFILDHWIRPTAAYKAFIDDPVKATKDFGAGIVDGGGKIVSGAADAIGSTVSGAAKAVDEALDSTIKKVTKPLDTVASWFG
jgi:hypothetical protein